MSALMRYGPLLLLATAVPVAALTYQAPLEQADWRVERSPRLCRLRHTIPALGEAVVETAGGSQRFFVQLSNRAGKPVEGPLTTGSAQLAAAAPFWNPQRESRPLGSVAVASSGYLLDIEGPRVSQLLRGLRDGLAAEISGRARSGEAAVQVVALPVYFQRAWRDYDACMQKLPAPPRAAMQTLALAQPAAVSTAAVKPAPIAIPADGLTFDYAPGEWQLQPAQRSALDALSQRLQTNASARIAIDGYGNDSYRRLLNLELSRKRAQAVSDYLVGRGIDAKRISVRFHGDEKISARRVQVKF